MKRLGTRNQLDLTDNKGRVKDTFKAGSNKPIQPVSIWTFHSYNHNRDTNGRVKATSFATGCRERNVIRVSLKLFASSRANKSDKLRSCVLLLFFFLFPYINVFSFFILYPRGIIYES